MFETVTTKYSEQSVNSLPVWAELAIEQLCPLSRNNSIEGAKKLAKWNEFISSFRSRWQTIKPENWKVPDSHPSYEGLQKSGGVLPPKESVRFHILIKALNLGWQEKCNGKALSMVRQAIQELTRLNSEIGSKAEELAVLFHQRTLLLNDHNLIESSNSWQDELPDPFDLFDALRLTLDAPEHGAFRCVADREIQALLGLVDITTQIPPGWEHLLDALGQRPTRVVTSGDNGAEAARLSSTNSTKWSELALSFFGKLDGIVGDGLPRGFLLDCLKIKHIVDLLDAVLAPPADTYSSEQITKLKQRYKRRKAQDDSTEIY